MMFLGNGFMLVGLIAFAAGIAFIVWSLRDEEAKRKVANLFGYIIAILAVINMLCISYYLVRYWHEGYFQTPAGVSAMQIKSTSLDTTLQKNQ